MSRELAFKAAGRWDVRVSAGDMLDMDLHEGRVVLSPTHRHPREGWAEAAKALADAGEGHLEWPELESDSDDEWTWRSQCARARHFVKKLGQVDRLTLNAALAVLRALFAE